MADMQEQVTRVTAMLREHSPETARHCIAVARYGTVMARALGLPERRVLLVSLAGLLHDVGKIYVASRILAKPGPLTPEEWAVVKEHPARGVELLRRCTALSDVLLAVAFHHERYDGTGYPAGLSGREIPLEARILSICNAYDAMITDRSYRRGVAPAEALARLREGAGTQFDPDLVPVFTRVPMQGEHLIAEIA
ncbi:MAG TPA: HD-GYP domain-containing protein [Symbiobacteriaceae bacterium]|nr:HD-GYP domain-containing protein [Symbiobacteriaceae bacterium]